MHFLERQNIRHTHSHTPVPEYSPLIGRAGGGGGTLSLGAAPLAAAASERGGGLLVRQDRGCWGLPWCRRARTVGSHQIGRIEFGFVIKPSFDLWRQYLWFLVNLILFCLVCSRSICVQFYRVVFISESGLASQTAISSKSGLVLLHQEGEKNCGLEGADRLGGQD